MEICPRVLLSVGPKNEKVYLTFYSSLQTIKHAQADEETVAVIPVFAGESLVDQRAVDVLLRLPKQIIRELPEIPGQEMDRAFVFAKENKFYLLLEACDDYAGQNRLKIKFHGRSVRDSCRSGLHRVSENECRLRLHAGRMRRAPHDVVVRRFDKIGIGI